MDARGRRAGKPPTGPDICLRHVEFFIAATFTNKYLRPLTADSQNSHQMADEFFSFRGGTQRFRFRPMYLCYQNVADAYSFFG